MKKHTTIPAVKVRKTTVPLDMFINLKNISMYLKYCMDNSNSLKINDNNLRITEDYIRYSIQYGEKENHAKVVLYRNELDSFDNFETASKMVGIFLKVSEHLKARKKLSKSWEQVIGKPNIEYISNSFESILTAYGWDIFSDPNMQETGKRIAKSWNEIFKGSFNAYPNIKSFDISEMDISSESNIQGSPEVFVGPIEIKSTCSHHMLPIVGNVYIEYKPVDKVLGLSKLPRLAKHIAARPMIQELYTKLLAQELHNITQCPVAVFVEAKHFCSYLRGVEDHSSKMITEWYIDYDEREKDNFIKKVNAKRST